MAQKVAHTNDHCCVPNCTNDARYDPKLSFHHFPQDPQRRKQWIAKIRRDPRQNSKEERDNFEVSNMF